MARAARFGVAVRQSGGTRLRQHELDVIVAGDIFIDLIMSGFAAWPAAGTEAFASGFRREIGGGAAITACGLARLGSRTAVLSVIGNDHGSFVADRLAASRVNTSDMRFDPVEPTALSVCISTPDDRSFLTYQGANVKFGDALVEAAGAGRLARARHVHLGWAPPLNSAGDLLKAIRDNGCSVSLDTGWHDTWLADPRAMDLLPMLAIFFPSRTEAQRMTQLTDPGECLLRFRDAGASKVALKLGKEGAALLWDGSITHAAPFPATPVDTIGAGDAFDAGFLHYWLAGEGPLACLQAANYCGAASTAAYGGIEAFPEAVRVRKAVNDSLCGR